MKNQVRQFVVLLLATIAWNIVGCSDDGNSTSTSSASSTGTGGGGGGGGGNGGSGNAKATPGTELSSAGDVVKSSKYKMVINFGGSTPAVGTMESPKHRLQGGLVGVTEGPK